MIALWSQRGDSNPRPAVTEKMTSATADPLARELALAMGDGRSLAYYRKVVREVSPSILLRARGEVLEEKQIKKSRGAMFACLVKKHTAAAGRVC